MNGGTTIAGTMFLANMAGVKVLATGGLGGVHQGGESSLDISADLTELGYYSLFGHGHDGSNSLTRLTQPDTRGGHHFW